MFSMFKYILFYGFLDDMVFITSDGISDNFDPVVGKFCVIEKPFCEEFKRFEDKENCNDNNAGGSLSNSNKLPMSSHSQPGPSTCR